MLSKILVSVSLACAFVSGIVGKPLPPVSRNIHARFQSFNNWGGISSMDNFDNFYGSNDFSGNSFSQTIIDTEEVVCHSEQIEFIQQRLLVLQEMAKRIITEQICEVETQVVVFQQFSSSMNSFSNDLRRNSDHQVGYDQGISGHFDSLLNSDGSLSNNDLGFTGLDQGQHTVVPSGSNWNDQSSPGSVNAAFSASQLASLGF